MQGLEDERALYRRLVCFLGNHPIVNVGTVLRSLVIGASSPGVGLLLIMWENGFNVKLSGNEVRYTNSLILLAENMLCSKLHCQKDLN